MRNYEKSIKTFFESDESVALAYFDLGTKKELNEKGRDEFVDFIFEGVKATTTKSIRDLFIEKVLDAYKKATKKK